MHQTKQKSMKKRDKLHELLALRLVPFQMQYGRRCCTFYLEWNLDEQIANNERRMSAERPKGEATHIYIKCNKNHMQLKFSIQ